VKEFIKKVLPKSLQRTLAKWKYREYIYATHKENIQEQRVVKIECSNKGKYNFLKDTLKRSFGGILTIDKYSFYYYPIAVIKVPNMIEEYLKLIGAKSRNMNKKAQKSGIECRVFDWNDYLDDIYEINTSSSVRQGREMDSAYQQYPKRIDTNPQGDFKIVHIGGFKEEKLVGYIELYIYGNFAMTNRILGHKEYLRFGIMNLMFKEAAAYAIQSGLEYINYLTMENRKNNSLSAFKYRVGFREYSLLELQ